jgi:hypothetical protein
VPGALGGAIESHTRVVNALQFPAPDEIVPLGELQVVANCPKDVVSTDRMTKASN